VPSPSTYGSAAAPKSHKTAPATAKTLSPAGKDYGF
jgi:hypothetical protein